MHIVHSPSCRQLTLRKRTESGIFVCATSHICLAKPKTNLGIFGWQYSWWLYLSSVCATNHEPKIMVDVIDNTHGDFCRPWLKGFATCTAKRREWKTITGELLLYNDMTIIYLFTYVSYKESFCKSSKLCYFQPLLNIKRSSATPGETHSDPTWNQKMF